jgi:hypothetical protein
MKHITCDEIIGIQHKIMETTSVHEFVESTMSNIAEYNMELYNGIDHLRASYSPSKAMGVFVLSIINAYEREEIEQIADNIKYTEMVKVTKQDILNACATAQDSTTSSEALVKYFGNGIAKFIVIYGGIDDNNLGQFITGDKWPSGQTSVADISILYEMLKEIIILERKINNSSVSH